MNPRRAIGGKHLNSGIRGGLWEVKHYEKMRDAVWLFGWFVHRQTTQKNGEGLVLRGMLLTYAEIGADTGWPRRTLQRWMARLQREGYVSVKHGSYSKLVVRILNAKKFNPKQLEFTLTSPPSSAPTMARISAPGVAHMGDKSGALKERAEFEQKLLRSSSAAWNFLGVDGSRFSPSVRDLCEKLYAAKNDETPVEFIGACMDAICGIGENIPAPLAHRAAGLRRTGKPVEELPELEAPAWAK